MDKKLLADHLVRKRFLVSGFSCRYVSRRWDTVQSGTGGRPVGLADSARGRVCGVQDSALAGVVQYRPSAAPEIGIEAEWEIDAQDLQLFNKLGEGEFGEVCMHAYLPCVPFIEACAVKCVFAVGWSCGWWSARTTEG